jgi:CheY-like chemotaxis protein
MQILKGGEHLLGLINEVLDLAKIEAGKVSLTIEDVPTGDVVDECMTLTERLAARKKITLENRTAEDGPLPMVWADYTRFKQILLNLLSNAVKYNREGGKVTLDGHKTDDAMLYISISDTGAGIPKNRMDELFQPFSRLGAEATDIEGTGIGLTITKQLVELMGGKIGVESEVGKGSRFWFELPLSGEGAARQEAARITKASQEAFADGSAAGNRKILYVEDNPANLRLMEEIISRVPNLSLLSAHTGEIGLELARSRKPHVILMDINLPGMDGYEALENLHSNSQTSNIPVIALSANAMPSDIEKGLMAGFHSYLTKPIKIDEVLGALSATLQEMQETATGGGLGERISGEDRSPP